MPRRKIPLPLFPQKIILKSKNILNILHELQDQFYPFQKSNPHKESSTYLPLRFSFRMNSIYFFQEERRFKTEMNFFPF